MVDQICKRCTTTLSCDIQSLANYCSNCGSKEFKLRAESVIEKNIEPFNGKKIISYRGKTWRK